MFLSNYFAFDLLKTEVKTFFIEIFEKHISNIEGVVGQ